MRKLKGYFNYEPYLISSFINNAEFDDRLISVISKTFRNWYLALTPKINLEKLIDLNIEELKPVLAWICTVNRFEELFYKINYDKYDEKILFLVEYCNLPDYANIYNKYRFIDSNSLKFDVFKMSKTRSLEGDLNLDIFNSRPTKSIIKNIYNYDRYVFLDSFAIYQIDKIEKYILNHSNLEITRNIKFNYTETGIFENIEIAMETFKYINLELFDACISKFVSIDPEYSYEDVRKFKPFLLYTNSCFNLDYLDLYSNINPLYKHVFIYTNILFKSIFSFQLEEYLADDDYIEYNLFLVCLASANYELLETLYNIYTNKRKCYKFIDFENREYLNNTDNIVLDLDDLISRIGFDISYHKNYSLII